jgi:hypothetical protein
VHEPSPLGPPANVQRVGRRLVYAHVSRTAHWNGLDILVGTHGRPGDGTLRLRVSSPRGNLLRQVDTALAGSRDNEWLRIRFSPIRNSRSRLFRLEFSLRSGGADSRLSVYETSPARSRVHEKMRSVVRRLGLGVQGGELYCRETSQVAVAVSGP